MKIQTMHRFPMAKLVSVATLKMKEESISFCQTIFLRFDVYSCQ